MCMMKSAIILKDRVFVPDYDHHTKMLEELGIEDTEKNAMTRFIRAELTPPNGDVFAPLSEWIFRVDQDITPDWYVPEYDERRMRVAVAEWAIARIYIDVNGLELATGSAYYLKNCHDVMLEGDCEVSELCSSEIGKMCGSSEIGTMYGSSKIGTMFGSSVATIPNDYYSKNINVSQTILCDDATIKDCRTRTIYQSGEWSLVSVSGAIGS